MRRLTLFLSIACLCACGSSAKQSKEAAAPAAAKKPAAKTAPATKAATRKPATKKPETRMERVKAALARIPEIEKGVAKIRGEAFKHPVPAEYQTQKDFRKFVQREIHHELPAKESKAVADSMYRIGLLKHPVNLATTLADAFVTQAGAYYDPKQKKFFVVMVPKSNLMLDTISSHELTHALQDQYFDLQKYTGDSKAKVKLTEDQSNARRFVVEGEATLVMSAYPAYAMTNGSVNPLAKGRAAALRMPLEMMAKTSVAKLRQAAKARGKQFAALGKDFKKALAAMNHIPPYVLVPMLEAYTKGALAVYDAYMAGGWAGVAKLYTEPPESTEQVLHPATKLIGKRDYPVALTLPKGPKGYKKVHSDVLGELLWRVYMSNWKVKNAAAAAAGWDGDRYTLYKKSGDNSGKLLGEIATTWDTKKDAKEFFDAYAGSLAARFSGAKVRSAGRHVKEVTRPDGTWTGERIRGKNVYIVDGAPKRLGRHLLRSLRHTRMKKDPRDH